MTAAVATPVLVERARRRGAAVVRCPACGCVLSASDSAWKCEECGRIYPVVAGIPDLRVRGDRYLSIQADRAKAERLRELSAESDAIGLANHYYDMTGDVDARRRRAFLSHLRNAAWRGSCLLAALPPQGSILEIGCGSGGLLVAAAQARREIIGVDLALRWLVIASRRLQDHQLSVPLVAAAAERLPWDDQSFDIVVADSVIEHLSSPDPALQECARVLRPGGRLVLWSPNRCTLLLDPHVQLWGIGWLPAAWARPYIRWRRGCAWDLNLHTAAAAARRARAAGFSDIQMVPPTFVHWSMRGAARNRTIISLYELLRHKAITRRLLLQLGPIWQLSATKPGEDR